MVWVDEIQSLANSIPSCPSLSSRVSFETSFDSKQPKLEPKLVSSLSETKRMFRLFRFFSETESFDVSIKPKQTKDQPKQFDREHILLFFTENLGFFRFCSFFFVFFSFRFCSHLNCSSLPPPPHLVECHIPHILFVYTPLAKTCQFPPFLSLFLNNTYMAHSIYLTLFYN